MNALLLNKDNPEMMSRVDRLLRTLIADAREHGYGEYRTHLDYMDAVAETYDFNGHALRRSENCGHPSDTPPSTARETSYARDRFPPETARER